MFGLTAAELAYATQTIGGVGDVMSAAGGQTVKWWNAENGGTQYTDLAGDRDGSTPATESATAPTGGPRATGIFNPIFGPVGIWAMWAAVGSGPRVLVLSSDVASRMGPAVDGLVDTVSTHVNTEGNPHDTNLDDLTDVSAGTVDEGYQLFYRTSSGSWVAEAPPGGGDIRSIFVQVTADGITDQSGTIQGILNALASSTQPLHLIIEGASKGTIYLNGAVRITTSNTKVTFAAPVKLGTGADPDGFGCLSILGTAFAQTTISSGATRGSSKVVVASTTGLTSKMLLRIYDDDTTGGASAGHKSEMAEIVDISGTTVYLDHPLHHTYSGTISVSRITPVINSGFDGVQATFSGQQAAGFVFPAKMQYVSRCFFRNMHFQGDPNNSWSRECFNIRWSYRCLLDNCGASFGWNYTVGTTYDYGFTADGATGCHYRSCYSMNVRHGFSSDKGAAGIIYTQCTVENATASAFDLHGGWVRDIIYDGCMATASDTRNASDQTKAGFLAGNTTFTNGAQYITYVGCVARNYSSYTPNGGSANSGEGAGFQVVDGCSNISIQACRVVDSMFGVKVLSQVGQPITNVTIMGCEFNGIAPGLGTAALPLWVTAGVAPNDVDGFVFVNNVFTNCASMASARIYGNSGNTLANVVIMNNVWRGPGVSGVYAIDIRYVDSPIIAQNTFYKARRGIQMRGCANAKVTRNIFDTLADGTDASRLIFDDHQSGTAYSTNLLFRDNSILGTTPTGWGDGTRDIGSTGANVDVMVAQRVFTTAGRPSASVMRAGAMYYDTTLSKPAWSDGTNWKDAAGTNV
jgi:hypothetical protein